MCLVDYYKEPSYGYAGVSGEFPHYRIEIKTLMLPFYYINFIFSLIITILELVSTSPHMLGNLLTSSTRHMSVQETTTTFCLVCV